MYCIANISLILLFVFKFFFLSIKLLCSDVVQVTDPLYDACVYTVLGKASPTDVVYYGFL